METATQTADQIAVRIACLKMYLRSEEGADIIERASTDSRMHADLCDLSDEYGLSLRQVCIAIVDVLQEGN